MKGFQYIRIYFITLFCLSFCTTGIQAQMENNKWIGTDDVLIDFNSGTPVLTPSPPSLLLFTHRSATISDKTTGTLLFHTNGIDIIDQNFNPMPNGNNLNGGDVLIVPFPNDADKYYVFTTGSEEHLLTYSLVDMSLNGGLGAVVDGQKNIVIEQIPVAGSIMATGGNNCDFWLIAHEEHTRNFRTYNITVAGINPTPVVSNMVPVSALGIFSFHSTVNMAISPNRKKIILTSVYAELCDFDPATGMVTNPAILIPDSLSPQCYFGCFSPDNSKLYLKDDKQLFQYSLDAGLSVIPGSKIHISDSTTGAQIRIGPDGKIYTPFGYYPVNGNTASTAFRYLSRISDPDATGVAAQYVPYAIAVPADRQLWYLPKEVPVLFTDTLFARIDTSICPQTTLNLVVNGDSVLWEDGSSTASRAILQEGVYYASYKQDCHWKVDTYQVKRYTGLDSFTLGNDTVFCQFGSFLLAPDLSIVDQYVWGNGSHQPTRSVDTSGIYTLQVTKDGCQLTDTIQIGMANLFFDFGAYPKQCAGDQLILSPLLATSGVTFTWQDGTQEPTYEVNETGTYRLTVEKDGCSWTDAVYIEFEPCYCIAFIPNAFSPNQDGLNDYFMPAFDCGMIRGYILEIYDRWGKCIYASVSAAKGWDGRFQGMLMNTGTYFYKLQYENLRGELIHRSGDVLLIR